MYVIECPITRKGCAINLVGQKIWMKNAFAKTSAQIDELIKRDWQHLRFDKSEKKSMRDRLSGYVKAGKKNEIRKTNYLARISKAWNVQQQIRFARLPYPRCSKTFFRRVITVVKLASTMSRRIIAIKKLNNIVINRLQNLRASILPAKWRFDSSEDWETLALDFGGCSIDDIADKTLQALSFHISATRYLEEGSPRFTDVTDLELTAKLAVVDNPGWVVTDSEEEVVKKKNKCTAKRKERLAKLCASVGSPLFFCPESSLFSTPRSISAPVPALFFRPGSPVVLSSGRLPTPAAVSR